VYDIHAELIRRRGDSSPFQWPEPDLETPLILGSLWGCAVSASTAHATVRTLQFFRSPPAPDVERYLAHLAREPVEGSFILALLAGTGVWISADAIPRVAAFASLADPRSRRDALSILALFEAIASSLCGACWFSTCSLFC